MAMVPNIRSIATTHINGSPVTIINEVILGSSSIDGSGGRKFTPTIKYIPSKTGLLQNVIVPQATIIGRVYIPEPLVGATSVTIATDDATAWTSGN